MHSSVNKHESRTFFGHPYPLGSLFLTEMWERFSFYGIRPLLILFMAATVYDGGMGLARENASAIVGIFAGTMYLAALPGGWLADNWLGQQKAVWYGSILIALGHLSIALSAVMGNNLFFIGLMFAVVFLITRNILILWPFFQPMGQLITLVKEQLSLPMVAALGFVEVLAVMLALVWLATWYYKRHVAQ